MDKNECRFKAGDFVYEPYSPQKPGKVISVQKSVSIHGWDIFTVEVKWIGGKISKHKDHNLKDFNALIADHKKKLNTHTSKLPLLSAL